MRFVDEVEIVVRAGAGGDGCVSFRREKYVPRGGPDGGDGGDGGSVILVGCNRLQTLADFEYRRSYLAERGEHGKGKNRHGASGRDIRLRVPLGTDVFDAATNDKLGELVEPGQELTVAAGGRGGRGNARFATAVNQAPRRAEPGMPGEERRLRLVLRLLADVGIVGLPNAGKSSLLATLTSARPRIAAYPFTTLTPNLGVLATSDFRFTVADMPGIVSGAHCGKGLGLRFLRHIERTRMIIVVVDAAAGSPEQDYRQVCYELERHDSSILKRPRLVALNKVDLLPLRRPGVKLDVQSFWVSARTGSGIDKLKAAIDRVLREGSG
ncbi:MAG: GTPase ObgE [candidate division WOR-3 bacterium]